MPTPMQRTGLPWTNKRLRITDPRRPDENSRPEWKLTPALRRYRPSKRIVQLAQPITRGEGDFYSKAPPKKPSRISLNFKVSERLLQLSLPPVKPPQNTDIRKNPFKIPRRALRAKLSPRVKELAEPRDIAPVIHYDPYTIPRAVLRAKASSRIIKLAKPKQIHNAKPYHGLTYRDLNKLWKGTKLVVYNLGNQNN